MSVCPRHRGKLGAYWNYPTTACQYPDHKGKQEAVKGDRFCNAQTARDIFQVFGVSIPVVCLLSVPYPWGYSFQKLIKIFLEDVRRPQKKYDFCCVSLRKYGCYSFTSEKMFYYTIKSTIIYYDQYKSACVLAHAKLTRP